MKIETYQCDVCGAQKGDTNHWWTIGIQTEKEEGVAVPFIRMHPASLGEVTGDPLIQQFDLCGEACVQRKVAEFMGSVKA